MTDLEQSETEQTEKPEKVVLIAFYAIIARDVAITLLTVLMCIYLLLKLY